MPLSHPEQTKLQTHGQPALEQGLVLGLAKKGKRGNHQPNLHYQLAENHDLSLLEKAFDILFEETLKKYGDLTTKDN